MSTSASSTASTNNLVHNSKNDSLHIRAFWVMWLLLLLFITLVFSLNMDVAPYLHLDEFMIVDLGRNTLNSETDWSVAWLSSQNKPVFVLSYLGPILQEYAFQSLGQYGPRISALIGGLFAATIMIGWLLARGTSRYVAFLLGLVFLLDPLFVQAYTVGRVDGWAIGVCLASCWVLRIAAQQLINRRVSRIYFVIAGMLASIAFFFWPSVTFLFPLIILELINVIKINKTGNRFEINILVPVALFCIGGIVALIIILLPITPQLYAHLETIIEGMLVNTRTGTEFTEQSSNFFSFNSIIEFRRVIKLTPFLVLVAFVAVIVQRQWGLLLAGLAVIILLLNTVIYMNRVLYLLPYFIVSVSALFQLKYTPSVQRYKLYSPILRCGSLMLLLLWAVGISLVARQMLIIYDNAEQDRTLVYHAAQSMIGEGQHSVLLFSPFEFYYAGRSMGWKMYRPYLSIGEDFSQEELKKVLPYVDYVIMEEQYLSNDLVMSLEEDGMKAKGVLNLYKMRNVEEDQDFVSSNLWRLRSLFHIHWQPYGPYTLYERKLKQLSSTRNP